ncbi:MAG TPA: pyrrolo-quinoline quinone [Verrucomicrobiae bacterium]|nr:pyrrolo-quinoline quinone [Verrucomicrobiae bacterium]
MRFPHLHAKSLSALVITLLTFNIAAHAQDVLTYRNNNARTSLDNQEKILTTSNVNVSTFGKLFVLNVDGVVDAQPLYLSNLTISGATHNVLIVVTENDSVYSFDADTGAQYWHISTLASGETASDDRGCDQVDPTIGITSTPVIQRPKTGDPIIYTVAMSKDSSGNYYQRLHALDATTGAEVHNGPKEITAKYPGTGDNSSGGYVIFDPSQYKERSGLLLAGGQIYLAWASHCDIRPYTGWIMAYNANTLAQTSVLNVTPNANEGAIWGSSAGLTSDNDGSIFFLDANGVFDTTLNTSGFPSSGDYGNAFMRLTTKGKLAVADYFEMYNEQNENCCDTDLGSGGTLLVPNQNDSSGNTWQLAAGAGKDGNLYLVNRANMGKFNSSSNNVYQELSGVLPGGMWNSPAFWAGRLYYGPVGSPILEFQFKNAKLSTAPIAQSANSFGFPGATLTISSNTSANAIVWAVENVNPAVLHAYSATKLTEIYNTTQASNGRDNFGNGNKYAPPTVANGKVYVPTTSGVGVFGLLSDKKK